MKKRTTLSIQMFDQNSSPLPVGQTEGDLLRNAVFEIFMAAHQHNTPRPPASGYGIHSFGGYDHDRSQFLVKIVSMFYNDDDHAKFKPIVEYSVRGFAHVGVQTGDLVAIRSGQQPVPFPGDEAMLTAAADQRIRPNFDVIRNVAKGVGAIETVINLAGRRYRVS